MFPFFVSVIRVPNELVITIYKAKFDYCFLNRHFHFYCKAICEQIDSFLAKGGGKFQIVAVIEIVCSSVDNNRSNVQIKGAWELYFPVNYKLGMLNGVIWDFKRHLR